LIEGINELRIGLAQSVSHRLEQGVPKARDLSHRGKLAWSDYQDVDLADGGHRRVAGTGVHCSELAEEVARPERIDLTPPLGDGDAPRQDQEEFAADPTLTGEGLPLGDLDPLGQVRNLLELRPRTALELVDRLEAVDRPFLSQTDCHGVGVLSSGGSARAGAAEPACPPCADMLALALHPGDIAPRTGSLRPASSLSWGNAGALEAVDVTFAAPRAGGGSSRSPGHADLH
jgi:hypothetical protein